MPVEEILVENGVVVGQGFCEPGEACGGDLFQRCLVGFVADATAIEHHPIFRVHRAENGERRRHHLQITRPTLEGHRLVGTNFLPIPFVSLIGKWFFYLFSMKTTDFSRSLDHHISISTASPVILCPSRSLLFFYWPLNAQTIGAAGTRRVCLTLFFPFFLFRRVDGSIQPFPPVRLCGNG